MRDRVESESSLTLRAAPRSATLPLRVPLPQGPLVFGLSRSAIYRAAAQGQIRLFKLGRGTLIDTASMLAYLEGMPTLSPKAAA